jgi:hypothetical protein
MDVLTATIRAYRGRLPRQTNDALTGTIDASALTDDPPIIAHFICPRVPARGHGN